MQANQRRKLAGVNSFLEMAVRQLQDILHEGGGDVTTQ
jgi:hypothetical protein